MYHPSLNYTENKSLLKEQNEFPQTCPMKSSIWF